MARCAQQDCEQPGVTSKVTHTIYRLSMTVYNEASAVHGPSVQDKTCSTHGSNQVKAPTAGACIRPPQRSATLGTPRTAELSLQQRQQHHKCIVGQRTRMPNWHSHAPAMMRWQSPFPCSISRGGTLRPGAACNRSILVNKRRWHSSYLPQRMRQWPQAAKLQKQWRSLFCCSPRVLAVSVPSIQVLQRAGSVPPLVHMWRPPDNLPSPHSECMCSAGLEPAGAARPYVAHACRTLTTLQNSMPPAAMR